MGPVAGGAYTSTAWAPGFRRREVKGIAVRAGERASAGTITLDLSGCDGPGVNCDSFFTGSVVEDPATKRITSSGYFELKEDCGADIDGKGMVQCAEGLAGVDFRLVRHGVGLSFAAENGARMALPNSSNPDCTTAEFGAARIRVDGLGPGVDLRVRGRRGTMAHVFFTDDVEREDRAVRLWQVVRRP